MLFPVSQTSRFSESRLVIMKVVRPVLLRRYHVLGKTYSENGAFWCPDMSLQPGDRALEVYNEVAMIRGVYNEVIITGIASNEERALLDP